MNGQRDEAHFLSFPWWASPAGINIGFLLPMFLLVVSADQSNFAGLTIRAVHFLTAPYIALGVSLLLITAFGGWLGGQIRIKRPTAKAIDAAAYERAALLIGSVALAAYLIFFRDFLLHPMLLVRTLLGSYRPDRTTVPPAVGITSFVNVAPVFFSIYGYFRLTLDRSVSRLFNYMFIVLLGFTLFRVYAWSERLALIEAVVPLALAVAPRLHASSKSTVRLISRLGPYAALPILVLYFGVAESVRSWTSSTYHQKLGFWQFVIGRLTSYYYSSLNNGAGVLTTTTWPTYKFEVTLGWLHKAPLVGHLFSALVNLRYYALERFLGNFGDEEFNNPSGLFGIIYDVGLPLGFIYFAAVGFAAALLLDAYRAGRRIGILLYPMFFLFFMEIFRYPYFGASRAFTWTLGILFVLVITHTTAPRESSATQAEFTP